jgi:hypothetical protein
MGSTPNLREKCLLVKEKWPIVLTPIAGFAIVAGLMRQPFRVGFNPCVAVPPRSKGVASSWWYWSATEGASAVA